MDRSAIDRWREDCTTDRRSIGSGTLLRLCFSKFVQIAGGRTDKPKKRARCDPESAR